MKTLFGMAAALLLMLAVSTDNAQAQCRGGVYYSGPVYYSPPPVVYYYCPPPPVYYCQPPRVAYYYTYPSYTQPKITRPAPSSTQEEPPPSRTFDKGDTTEKKGPIRRPAPSSTYEPK